VRRDIQVAVIEGLDFNLHVFFIPLPFAPAVSRHGLDHKCSIEVQKSKLKNQNDKPKSRIW
jgi:hypothetical protein